MFDRQAILEDAALNPARGLPATMGERAAIDAEVFASTQMSMSAQAALFNHYSDYLNEVFDITGKRLPNPFNADPSMRPRMEQIVQDEIGKLRDEFPDLPVLTPEDIRAAVGRERAALFAEQADIHARTIDPLVSAAGFAAQMPVAVVDPPVLMSMFFGAPYASGILRGALIEAGIAAGVEIPIQAAVQLGRRQFGEEPSLGEAAMAVGAAGGGGFVLSSLIRGMGRGGAVVARGTRNLLQRVQGLPPSRRTSSVRSAEAYLGRMAEAEEMSPLPDTPAARAEHARRLSEAEMALRESRAADMPDRPAHTPRWDYLDRAAAAIEHAEEVIDQIEVVSELGRAAKAAARLREDERAAVELAGLSQADPEKLADLYKALRARPDKPETLMGFLTKTGGLKDQAGELKAIGITSRTRPGLLRKDGRTLDDATLAAWEAGFFPGKTQRPEINDLLEALRREAHGRPVVRLDDMEQAGRQADVDALNDALISAGIDARKLRQGDFAERARGLAEAVVARDAVAAVDQAKAARAAAEAEDVRTLAAADDADLIVEEQVRAAYRGREDEVVLFETAEGMERQSIREMFEEFDRNMDDFAALEICARGSGG